MLRTLESVTGTADAEITSEEDLFRLLPDERIEGAHLPRFTSAHWVYAALSAAGFLGAVILLFDLGKAKWWQLLAVAASTATVGIVFLLMVQWIAAFTGGWLVSRNPLFLIVYYAFKFIGFSYNCAVDPNTGFLLSFFGFTFGVGLLEEFTKAMPILFMLRGNMDLDWRGAAVWGLASGIGFGVAEGIIYSADFYNGVAAGDIYVVRFVSCVALHAIWAAAVAVMITRYRDEMQQDWDWPQMLFAVLKVQAVPMVLHGLYDVMLKKDMNFPALMVALVSFLWLAFMIERSRREEGTMMARNAARWARTGIA